MNLVIVLTTLIAFSIIFTIEVIAPASKNSCDKRWLILASTISLVQSISTLFIGWLYLELLHNFSLFNLKGLNILIGGFLGFLVTSFFAYWWHRAMHKSDFLWRTFHQLHHSPNRIESLTAFYLHPFDSMAATLLNALCCLAILGLSIESAAISLILASLYNLFIHADLKTPYWLGFVIQRPEMHRLHHKTGHHAQNYGLSILDMVFNTFSNPKKYIEDVGFEKPKSEKIYEMLMTKDVYK